MMNSRRSSLSNEPRTLDTCVCGCTTVADVAAARCTAAIGRGGGSIVAATATALAVTSAMPTVASFQPRTVIPELGESVWKVIIMELP
jgi:hypothetical protein